MSAVTSLYPISETSTSVISSQIPYSKTISSRIHRFTYDHNDLVFRVSCLAIAILIYQTLLISTAATTVLVAGAVTYGASNGHRPLKVLGHFKTLPKTVYNYFVPPKHLMSTHTFIPSTFESCSLRYEGDVPVLTLSGEDPFSIGQAHGYLLAPQIQRMTKVWGSILWAVIPGGISAESLCDHLKEIIPPILIKEMTGLVEGFNSKMSDMHEVDRITLNELLLFHLVADAIHTFPTTLAKKITPGCTTIVDKDYLIRNLDWPTLGAAGPASFICRRIYPNGKITHEVGFAGLIGTLTALSNRGFSLSMNVALGTTQNPLKGLPALILNRLILNECDTVQDAAHFLKSVRPIGPYHLSMLDKSGDAMIFHFYQEKDDQDHIRFLGEENVPLVTTNCRYSSSGRYDDYFDSFEREANITLAFLHSTKDRRETILDALKAPLVMNQETSHVVEMNPKTGELRVVFGNAFAGDMPMHDVKFPDK